MKPHYHFIATLAISGILYGYYRCLSCGVISFIAGFLIDIDHVIDYYLHQGINLNLRRFLRFCYEHQFEYLSVIFHSFELLIILWGAIAVLKLGPFWISIAIGMSQHMLFDLVLNAKELKTHYFYFFSIRALKGFRVKEFLARAKLK